MTRFPLEVAWIAGLILLLPSLCTADDVAAESSSIQLMPDPRTMLEDPCENLVDPATMTP